MRKGTRRRRGKARLMYWKREKHEEGGRKKMGCSKRRMKEANLAAG